MSARAFPQGLHYRVATSTRSLAGLGRLALDPHLQTSPLPPTPTTRPTPTTSLTFSTRPPSPTTRRPPRLGRAAARRGRPASTHHGPQLGCALGTSKPDCGGGPDGRKFDIVHVYRRWSQDLPPAEERAAAAEGRLLPIHWKSPGSWAAVANGSHDGQITATATRLKGVRPQAVPGLPP